MKAEDFSVSSHQGNSNGISSKKVALVCNMPSPTSVGSRNGQNFNKLSRQVSQDLLPLLIEGHKGHDPQYVSGCEEDEDVASEVSTRCSSPMRCVSECDKGESTSKRDSSIPFQPNPLHCPRLFSVHVQACRLEAELLPLRQILSRTMYHPTLNRKGIFNSPVDPIALRLPDYHLVITQPMDLGTVKTKLYSVEYKSRHEVVRDIRLVFQNAMKYNPPINPVHLAAKELMAFFNEAYLAVYPDDVLMSKEISTPLGIARTVSSCETEPLQDVLKSGGLNCTPLSKAAQGLQTTRRRSSLASGALPSSLTLSSRKRRLSVSFDPTHSCDSCLGKTCGICQQGCLPLEPALLICNGVNCTGAKIRKGAMYYIAPDGSRQYCQRCYSSLGAVLPQGGSDEKLRYKRDLLKRKNDEELEERWIKCKRCDQSVHRMCVMYNDYITSADDFVCPKCVSDSLPRTAFGKIGLVSPDSSTAYTFVSGTDKPVLMSELAEPDFISGQDVLSSDSLQETAISAFIQKKVRELVQECGISPNAERTIFVRVISDCNKSFKVPDVVRKHFRMMDGDKGDSISPPEAVKYNSKCIALFQKIDGLDVCIFSMYVQEYDGYREAPGCNSSLANSRKRVYIAYLDSVEHFRPRPLRTSVYHEVLVSYLAIARERGYEDAYIWACPPSRGNSFVFWNHPSSQRTPTTERLVSWYHGALSRAIDSGIVTDVRSLFETAFEKYLGKREKDYTADLTSGRMPCPPLLDGDFWIEEASRIHSSSIARHLKTRLPSEADFAKVTNSLEFYKQRLDPCPAIQISILLRERLMAHPSSVHFRRPVNAAALKLKDYHIIVTRPMDFGTIFSKCVHGEYVTLFDLVADVELVVSNAKLFNPEGHFVHNQANEVHSFFFEELNTVTSLWRTSESSDHTWATYGGMSMSLDKCLTEGASETEVSANKDTGCIVAPACTESRPLTPMSERKLVAAGAITPCCDPREVNMTSPNKSLTNELPVVSAKVSPSNNSRKIANPDVRGIELLSGPEAVQHKMVGGDTWLMDKRNTMPPKRPSVTKKACHKRRRSSVSASCESSEEPTIKRRRQTWLGEEVGEAIRRMRTTFFACSLKVNDSLEEEDEDRAHAYKEYVKCFDESEFRSEAIGMSRIADARHVLLEFSQFRNLEFDTLRHAKFSTSVILYHLHHKDAPGMVPVCTSCKKKTEGVRWHKIKRAAERRRSSKSAPKVCKEGKWSPEELCSDCYSSESRGDDYNPIQVSLRSSGSV